MELEKSKKKLHLEMEEMAQSLEVDFHRLLRPPRLALLSDSTVNCQKCDQSILLLYM